VITRPVYAPRCVARQMLANHFRSSRFLIMTLALIAPLLTPAEAQTSSNRAPGISGGTPPSTVKAGSYYTYGVYAWDHDGDTLVFSARNLPSWLAMDRSSGRIRGTPSASNVGVYRDIVISVSDGKASSSLAPFTISVLTADGSPPPPSEPEPEPDPDNRAPGISGGTPPSTVKVGSYYTYGVYAWDHDGDTLVFSARNLPSWLAVDRSSGRIRGTPSASHVGVYRDIVISVSDGKATSSLAAFTISVLAADGSSPPPSEPEPDPDNRAPGISGTPPTSVTAGDVYTFGPYAWDHDGDTLTFSASNLPSWLSLDRATGRIRGTPTAQQVGTYSNIRISVSDGNASASLAAFSITVLQSGSASGSVTLSWQAPTQNTDGSPLRDLSGYRVRYGTSPSSLTRTVTISNPGITSAVIADLASGTWYFAVTAVNSQQVESSLSAIVSKRL